MLVKIHGLPAHVLLIHAVVVLLPLAAGMLVASAVWPAARRKLGFLTPALALVVLVLVPITTHAGEWLRDRLPETKQLDKHAALGHDLLPWAIGLFVVAAGVWLLGRRYEFFLLPSRKPQQPVVPSDGGGGGVATATRTTPATRLQTLPVWLSAVVAVIAVGVAVGATVQLVRIGDSGAQAVWSGTANLPKRGG